MRQNIKKIKMKKHFYIWFALLCMPCLAYTQTNNEELQKMFNADQAERQVATIDWEKMRVNDSTRKKRTYEMIKLGEIKTGKDYYNSAMIFQHGHDTIDSQMAVKHMRKAIELDSTINKWLLAAAIDRDLMRRGKPQIYGTQYQKGYGETKWKRYTLDSTKVTDEERKKYRVETLAEQQLKLKRMNMLKVVAFYEETHSLQKVIQLIKSEFKKKEQATYDVSEGEINSFGYALMQEQKTQDALQIFQLNTELYPKGFNTYDSLGECLLLLNKKEEGIKAYKKSLELNPKNENASEVLSKIK